MSLLLNFEIAEKFIFPNIIELCRKTIVGVLMFKIVFSSSFRIEFYKTATVKELNGKS